MKMLLITMTLLLKDSTIWKTKTWKNVHAEALLRESFCTSAFRATVCCCWATCKEDRSERVSDFFFRVPLNGIKGSQKPRRTKAPTLANLHFKCKFKRAWKLRSEKGSEARLQCSKNHSFWRENSNGCHLVFFRNYGKQFFVIAESSFPKTFGSFLSVIFWGKICNFEKKFYWSNFSEITK